MLKQKNILNNFIFCTFIKTKVQKIKINKNKDNFENIHKKYLYKE